MNTLDFDKLAYPGMFAQICETDWVQVYRPTGWEKSNNKIGFCIKGFNKVDDVLELNIDAPNPIQDLLNSYPFLSDLEFEPVKKGSCTRQVASIIEKLKELGVQDVVISRCWSKIQSVKMPFAPDIWADLANKKGKYLPACCANISAARDEYLKGLREDGYLSTESLCNIVECIDSSHEFNNEPLSITKHIWDLVQPVADIFSGARPLNGSNINDAISMLGDFCNMYAWATIDSEFPTFYDRACVTNELYTVIPAIKTIFEKINELNLGPIWGFAICPRHGEDDIFKTLRGLSVWRTYEEAEKSLKRWIDTEQVKESEVAIRPIKISIENGIEFLGPPVQAPVGRPFED
jgi:hypothetical protein